MENYKKYKIINKVLDGTQTCFEIDIPGKGKRKYIQNPGRQCLVGREYISYLEPDLYHYKLDTSPNYILLKPVDLFTPIGSDYYAFYFTDNFTGKQEIEYAHRAILYSWNEDYRKNLQVYEVDHKDHNKANNHLSNLRPVSKIFNSLHEVNNGNPKGVDYLISNLQLNRNDPKRIIEDIVGFVDAWKRGEV